MELLLFYVKGLTCLVVFANSLVSLWRNFKSAKTPVTPNLLLVFLG
jgi:hypothetical protein